jgi:phosphate:Na+ symporter
LQCCGVGDIFGAMIATILGGIGLFLLGMVLLTDGLKTAAGAALRNVLGRFTGGTLRAIASGAGLTALVQSSSATVLTTIGFVSAGLLTLRQAIGVIVGANLGTTSTGWIVSLLGLKLSIGAIALPLVGVGALLRLLTRDRLAATGIAIAGFGLIFVGIDVLQQGMATLSTRFDSADLPGATAGGRILLVGIGMVMTVVMQSSSAAVATTLTALHTGTISLDQAAALVVGQSIGTSVTAALAAVGASISAKRTAVAHILFNLLTGVIGFLLIPAASHLEVVLGRQLGIVEPALLIAAFHTTFKLAGVLLLAPAIAPFTRLVERIVPDATPALTRHLDASVAELPQVAVEAARRVVMEAGDVVINVLGDTLRDPRRGRIPRQPLDDAALALQRTRRFLAGVRTAANESDHARHLSLHHAMDHLDRLMERLQHHTPDAPADDPAFDEMRRRAAELAPALTAWLRGESDAPPPVRECQTLSAQVAERRRMDRNDTLARTAAGTLDPELANANLAAMRWLDSALYHAWRATHHLAVPDPLASAAAPL